MIRHVHDAPAARRLLGVRHAFGDAADFAKNRIERVLQRAVEPIALRGAELDEVLFDALTRLAGRRALNAAQVSRDIVSSEYSARDLVGPHEFATIPPVPRPDGPRC